MRGQPQEMFDLVHTIWGSKFADDGLGGPGAVLPHEQRLRIGLAVKYYSGRFAPGEMQTAAMCFVATKIVRHILRAGGLRADPVTVTLEATHGDLVMQLGERHPRLSRRSMGPRTHHIWTGHEVVHLPDYGLILDPSALQLAVTYDVALVYPVVAAAPPMLRSGDRIAAVVQPLDLPATYTVQPANFDYRKVPGWPDVERIAEEGIAVVNRFAQEYADTDEYRRRRGHHGPDNT